MPQARKRKLKAAVRAFKRQKRTSSKARSRSNRGKLTRKKAIFGVRHARIPFYRHQPAIVRSWHKNEITIPISVTGGSYISPKIDLRPGHLRDIDNVRRSQPYPEDYLRMCKLYRKYRVYGVSVSVLFRDIGNNENAQFWVCTQTWPSYVGPAAETVNSNATRDAFMQNKHIPKKLIRDTGIQSGKRGTPYFNQRFKSIATMEENNLNEMGAQYECTVDTNGNHLFDPRTPLMQLFLVSPRSGGFPGGDTYHMHLKIKFLVEWKHLRQETDATLAVAEQTGETVWPQPTEGLPVVPAP